MGLNNFFGGISKYFGEPDSRFDTALAAGIDASRLDYPLGTTEIVRVLMLGDSITLDPVRRRHVQAEVRALTDGVQFVGTVGLGSATGGVIGDSAMQYWCHDGVTGNTMAQILARIPTIATALGKSRAPHIIDLMMATNDISQSRALAQIEADARAVIAGCKAAWPGVWIVLNAPPIWSSPATDAATKDLLRAQVWTLFASFANEYDEVLFVNGLATMTNADQLSDGTHINDRGAALTARYEARAIVSIMGMRRPVPATAPWSPAGVNALVFDTPATDAGTIASDADLAPGTSSFCVIIRFSLDAFPPDGSVYSLVSLGATAADGYTLAVFKVANIAKAGLSVYLTNGNSIISGNAGYPSNKIELLKEYELMFLADDGEDKAGMWLNGQTIIHSIDLVALGRGADWDIAAAATKFGRNALSGIAGRMRSFEFYKGSSVPSIWDAPRYAEDHYRHGKLLPGNPLIYKMDEGTGSPVEQQGRAGAMTLSGVTWGTIL